MNNEWIEEGRGPISSAGIVRELLSSDQITIQSPLPACDGISAFQKVGTRIDAHKEKTTQPHSQLSSLLMIVFGTVPLLLLLSPLLPRSCSSLVCFLFIPTSTSFNVT